ncbi:MULTISPECIES: hypothetical protein [Streptomyces]|uniref:Uncharacterized protein n=3 Tax=Streptomyces TaxID=1883 RepID=A0A6G3T3E6_STRAQ|nr:MULTISPECIES: hypothetical protein [Streptomyces]NEE17946.1 hypothetical protein [Streptomyces sp. SID7499]NDZ57503.1 hypothetical protein [Streptomyces anulatus]NEB89689.1 hypothetical protein [Streptomyces anulatus]NEB98012.1 hypothetical protein [Streptomyces anulatus]NED29971.1 hypothetical protein [Streptomyces anulatus]
MTSLPPAAVLLAATFSPGPEAGQLLGLLAWCASAAGVGGVITVGTLMALQLRSGEHGEGGQHFRGLFFVMLASVLASTAGPLVAALGSLAL